MKELLLTEVVRYRVSLPEQATLDQLRAVESRLRDLAEEMRFNKSLKLRGSGRVDELLLEATGRSIEVVGLMQKPTPRVENEDVQWDMNTAGRLFDVVMEVLGETDGDATGTGEESEGSEVSDVQAGGADAGSVPGVAMGDGSGGGVGGDGGAGDPLLGVRAAEADASGGAAGEGGGGGAAAGERADAGRLDVQAVRGAGDSPPGGAQAGSEQGKEPRADADGGGEPGGVLRPVSPEGAPRKLTTLELARSSIYDVPLIAFDAETTGVDPQEARIVEIGVVLGELRHNSKPAGKQTRLLLNPGVPREEWKEAQKVCGWTPEELDVVYDGPSFREVRDRVVSRLSGGVLVGYNVQDYDLPLLQAEERRAGFVATEYPLVIDVLTVVRHVLRGERSRKLEDVAKMAGYRGRSHRAVSDCWAVLEVLGWFLLKFQLPENVEEIVAQLAEWKEQQDADGRLYSYWLYRDWTNRKVGWRKHELMRENPLLVAEDCPLRDDPEHCSGDVRQVLGDGREELVRCTCGCPLMVGAGKECGKPLAKADRGYLSWMLTGGKVTLPEAAAAAVAKPLFR
jgi:DNA polymerase III subunit epsilon